MAAKFLHGEILEQHPDEERHRDHRAADPASATRTEADERDEGEPDPEPDVDQQYQEIDLVFQYDATLFVINCPVQFFFEASLKKEF